MHHHQILGTLPPPMTFLLPMHEGQSRFSSTPRHYPCLLAISEKASNSFVACIVARSVRIAATVLSLFLPPCLFDCFLSWFARVDCAVYLFVGYLKYAYYCVIELFSGDIARNPPACFQDVLSLDPQRSKPTAEGQMKGIVWSRKTSVRRGTGNLPVGTVAEVVPVDALGGHESLVDLQLPPAYTPIVETDASEPYVNTVEPQLHSTTGLDDQRLSISRSVPTFYYEVGSDPSGKSPRFNWDPASSVSTSVDTPYHNTDPSLVAITASTSIPGGLLSTSPTSRTLGDMPILRRQPLPIKDTSNSIVVGSIPGPSEHRHWLRACAVCAKKKAKITKAKITKPRVPIEVRKSEKCLLCPCKGMKQTEDVYDGQLCDSRRWKD